MIDVVLIVIGVVTVLVASEDSRKPDPRKAVLRDIAAEEADAYTYGSLLAAGMSHEEAWNLAFNEARDARRLLKKMADEEKDKKEKEKSEKSKE